MIQPGIKTGATFRYREGAALGEEVSDPEQERKELEQEAYREAVDKLYPVVNAILAHIGGRLLKPNADLKDVLTDFWAVCYALGSYLCEGIPMAQRAHELGIERATLSGAAVRFCIGNNLPPSEYLREPETMRAYMDARLRAIEKENERCNKAA